MKEEARIPMREIQPGMYVRSVANPDVQYVVTENDGDRLVAVAIVQILVPKDWEVLDSHATMPTFKPIVKNRPRR
jgi:hypothetical protein